MLIRIAFMGCLLALLGCGREPERSRVVPSSEVGRNPGDPPRKLAPGEIRKIEMH